MASLKKRGKFYYAQYYVGGRQKRVSLDTSSLQIAREKIRQLESARFKGEPNPLPTRTMLDEILTRYVEHIRAVKTPKSAQTHIYYLRQMFGTICDALRITSRRPSCKAMKRPPRPGQDRRFKMNTIEVTYLEQITTNTIADFISSHVRSRGLAPKTANHYRGIVNRLFNWVIEEQGVKMPAGVNPVAKVSRYKEHAPRIRFLTLAQINEHLSALRDNRLLQTLLAVYVCAGLRREEALWLTISDVDLEAGRSGMIRAQAKIIDGLTWQPKTKRNRAVPISSTLREYLEDYTPMLTKGRWLFPSPKGKHYDPDNFSRDPRNANRKVGLPWTCLDYRHTFWKPAGYEGAVSAQDIHVDGKLARDLPASLCCFGSGGDDG